MTNQVDNRSSRWLDDAQRATLLAEERRLATDDGMSPLERQGSSVRLLRRADIGKPEIVVVGDAATPDAVTGAPVVDSGPLGLGQTLALTRP